MKRVARDGVSREKEKLVATNMPVSWRDCARRRHAIGAPLKSNLARVSYGNARGQLQDARDREDNAARHVVAAAYGRRFELRAQQAGVREGGDGVGERGGLVHDARLGRGGDGRGDGQRDSGRV